jgi:hypothetical protein
MDFSKFKGLDADFLAGRDSGFYADVIGRLGYTPANKAGDTMIGMLQVVDNPTQDLQAVNKAYVDAAILAKLQELGIVDTFCDCKGIAFFLADGFLTVERCANIRGAAFVDYDSGTKIATISLSDSPGYSISATTPSAILTSTLSIES